MLDYEHARHRMVEAHIARRGVRDERILSALRRVPREAFVDEGFEEFAYEDSPLPIGSGQTISQLFIVARMTEAAEVEASDRVLEIGTGSGYAAAVLAELAAEVFTVERHRELAKKAETRLHGSAHRNVFVRVGDGTKGWPEKALFCNHRGRRRSVCSGLASGPTGNRRTSGHPGCDKGVQRLLRVPRVSANKFEEEDLGGVMFVPSSGRKVGSTRPRESEPAKHADRCRN